MEQIVGIPGAVMDVLKSKGSEDRICIVGASSNSRIHHHVLVKNLARKGYGVVTVKPTARTIAAHQHDQSVQGLIAGETRRGRLCVL